MSESSSSVAATATAPGERFGYRFHFSVDTSSHLESIRALNQALAAFGVPPSDRIRLETPLTGSLTVARQLSPQEIESMGAIIKTHISQALAEFNPRFHGIDYVGPVA